MVSFFKHRVPKDASDSSIAPHSVTQHESASRFEVHRDLIRAVLKNTLHRLGIPQDWLVCEVIPQGQGTGQEKLHIQLILMKWQETFLRYAPALERQLLRGLIRIDPSIDATNHIIAWRFSPDCGCPFKVMPPPKVWAQEMAQTAPVKRQTKPLAMPVHSPLGSEDTQTLRTPLHDDDDYERTQLSPLG